MVLEFMSTLTTVMAILDPAEAGQLDEYCTGYVYGLEGSKVMVTLANRFVNPKDKDGNTIPFKEQKEKLSKIDFNPGDVIKKTAKDFEKGVTGIAKDVVGTINNVIKKKTGETIAAAGAGSDEL